MSRTVDKTKKSNIKCEHCKYWDKNHLTILYTCRNKEAERYGKETHYYNRCKLFKWEEQE